MLGDATMGGEGDEADGHPAREVVGPQVDPDRSRQKGAHGGRNASGTIRICKKCDEPLTGQFVRALGGTFHLDCFKCQVSDGFIRDIRGSLSTTDGQC